MAVFVEFAENYMVRRLMISIIFVMCPITKGGLEVRDSYWTADLDATYVVLLVFCLKQTKKKINNLHFGNCSCVLCSNSSLHENWKKGLGCKFHR